MQLLVLVLPVTEAGSLRREFYKVARGIPNAAIGTGAAKAPFVPHSGHLLRHNAALSTNVRS